MLSSIHPLGERSRGNRWTTTVVAFAIAAAAGGALLGAAAGAVGLIISRVPRGIGAVAAIAAALAGALVDATRWPRWLPRPTRQVDENWLQAYRGWVYGSGFGFQLGVGFATIVTGASFYVALLLIMLTGSVATGAVIGAVFGATRGLSLVTGRRITSPEALLRFHRTLDRMQPAARAASVIACLIGAGAAAATLSAGA